MSQIVLSFLTLCGEKDIRGVDVSITRLLKLLNMFSLHFALMTIVQHRQHYSSQSAGEVVEGAV